MFTKAEFALIRQGLDMAMASCGRLANRVGQNPAVSEVYRKAAGELAALKSKVIVEEGKVK